MASAWSRSNLPPFELDQMFRAVEAVYKANRSLLSVSDHTLISSVYTEYNRNMCFLETERDRDQSLVTKGLGRSPHALGRWIYAVVPGL